MEKALPFGHQVAGHTVFLDGGRYVHKLCILRELSLYLLLSAPEEENEMQQRNEEEGKVEKEQQQGAEFLQQQQLQPPRRERVHISHFFPRFIGVSKKRTEDEKMTLVESFAQLYENVLQHEQGEQHGERSSSSSSGSNSSSNSLLLRKASENGKITATEAMARVRKHVNTCWEPNVPHFTVLENLTFAMNHPCLMDIKLGVRQHTDDEPLEKQRRKQAKCRATTSAVLGLRICGFKVWDESIDAYRSFDKYHGRSLTHATVGHSLRLFLQRPDGTIRLPVLRSFIAALEQLILAIEAEKRFIFYSSSVLLVYNGDDDNGGGRKESENDNDDDEGDRGAVLKFIDFAHTVDATSSSSNSLSSPLLRPKNGSINENDETAAAAAAQTSSSSSSSSSPSSVSVNEGTLLGCRNLLRYLSILNGGREEDFPLEIIPQSASLSPSTTTVNRPKMGEQSSVDHENINNNNDNLQHLDESIISREELLGYGEHHHRRRKSSSGSGGVMNKNNNIIEGADCDPSSSLSSSSSTTAAAGDVHCDGVKESV